MALLLIVLVVIRPALLFSVAVNVHSAVLQYLTKMSLLPVRATVAGFVSTTVPETVGLHFSSLVVAVSGQVDVPTRVFPLYVSHVNVP